MKLIKDEGLKVQVEITQEDWVALADCLVLYVDRCETHAEECLKKGDEENAKAWESWKESPAALLNVVPNDFLVRKGKAVLSITNN